MVFLFFLVFFCFFCFFCFFWFFWFSREKDGFLVRNHLFLEKKMVLSKHPSENHLFLEKKMVFPGEDLQKPSFSREKDGFTPKNHLFLEKTKKTIFWRAQPHSFGKDGFFLFFLVFWVFLVFSRKRWFFGSKPSFSREKDGFEQPSFEKPSFSREKMVLPGEDF